MGLIKIKTLVEKSINVLVITHRNPDGDAVGSLAAVGEYLFELGKKYTLFCLDEIPEKYLFLNKRGKISEQAELLSNNFDLILALDCGDIHYTGIYDYLIKMRDIARVAVIDHHASNPGWGEVNLIDGEASSTTEILYNYFRETGARISKNMADALLTGILTDTENFVNSATRWESIETSAQLLARGARYNQIIRQIYRDKKDLDLRVWGRVLSNIKKNDKLKIVHTVMTRDELGEVEPGVVDGISNFVSNLKEMNASLVFRETKDGRIRVSLRALNEKMNVLKIARAFGGGGHEAAAGFSLEGRMERTEGGWQII